jgi:hypothetical protein
MILVCFCFAASSQTYLIDEQFTSAPAVPVTLVGTGAPFGSTSGVSNYGRNAPSIQFKTNNQTLTYGPWTGNADHISFFHKGLSGAGSQIEVTESVDGVAWTVVDTADVITTAATFDANLLSTSRYVRLTFILVATCYTYIDDLRIRAQTDWCVEPPVLLQVLINGGCASCEGANEFIYFDTGGHELDINYLEVVSQTVPTGGCAYGGNGAGDNQNVNWVLNSNYSLGELSYISDLNLWAGCSGVFVPVPANNILPAQARVLAFTGAMPNATYNFSSICSLGTVYVIFASQTDCGGKYANSSCSTFCERYLTLFNHETGCLDNQVYQANPVNTSAANAYIFVGSNIGYTSTANCSFLMLASKMKEFTARIDERRVHLSWILSSAGSTIEFEIERSIDGQHFLSIGSMPVRYNESESRYDFYYEDVSESHLYYRIRMLSLEGISEYSEVVSLYPKVLEEFYAVIFQNEISIISPMDISPVFLEIYNSTGKCLFSKNASLSAGNNPLMRTASFVPGLYFITIRAPNGVLRLKVMK